VEIPAGIDSGFYRVVKSITEDEAGTGFNVDPIFRVA